MSARKVVLTVRCTQEEADAIRFIAQHKRQSISSYIVYATCEYIRHMESRIFLQKSAGAPPSE